jgi:hypothetical protein
MPPLSENIVSCTLQNRLSIFLTYVGIHKKIYTYQEEAFFLGKKLSENSRGGITIA